MSINNNQGWRLSQKDEVVSDIKNHFYIFVNLKGPGSLPEYYIVPQKKLANYLYNDHRVWLTGKEGRKDSSIRAFDPYRRKDSKYFGEKYKNNWD